MFRFASPWMLLLALPAIAAAWAGPLGAVRPQCGIVLPFFHHCGYCIRVAKTQFINGNINLV